MRAVAWLVVLIQISAAAQAAEAVQIILRASLAAMQSSVAEVGAVVVLKTPVRLITMARLVAAHI
jgi:hypothetical protein